jgi:hypothetical protein
VKWNLRWVGKAERVIFGYGDSDEDSSEETEEEVNMWPYFFLNGSFLLLFV